VVVLCPDEETSATLAGELIELNKLSRLHQKDEPSQKIHAFAFPGFERSLFSSILPSIQTKALRSGGLRALASPRSTPVAVFTTLQAASLRTLPLQDFLRASFELQVGQSFGSREALTERLIQAGYSRTDTAEDPATFALRGDILDVIVPDATEGALALRIEFFDDQVERIRHFDPGSQRTISEGQNSAWITPCREVLIHSKTIPRLRAELKSLADESGIPRKTRDPILEQVSLGAYPEFSELWAGLVYESPASLWDYVSSTDLLVIDPLWCQQKFDAALQEDRELFAALSKNPGESWRISPTPESTYDPRASDLNSTLSQAKLILSSIDLTEPADLQVETGDQNHGEPPPQEKTGKHQVLIRTNSDLASGSGKGSLDTLEEKVTLWTRQGFQVIASARTRGQADRFAHLLENRGLRLEVQESLLEAGFRWPTERLVIITEQEILGEKGARRRKGTKPQRPSPRDPSSDWLGLHQLSDLSPGDPVVHLEHGIGRYQGLVRLNLTGAASDFLLLEYANQDKLYLPVHRLNLIQKHGGAGPGVTLDRLGSQQFLKTKEKVKESIKRLAIDLVKLYAERQIRSGFRFSRRDPEFEAFEASFPYDETPDQAQAIEATLEDMAQGKIMDRLICGDVGYGKTEVAIRAAYRAALDGKQVAVLVPTTLLAHQHEASFRSRLAGRAVSIESISRFKPKSVQTKILKSLATGSVDVVIGTHRLLSRDIHFKDLGLLIVDEEHRFGVEHKEKLKALKLNVPVLTLTATPIPRTLHLSLSGLRDISLIRTPPVNRLPIRTYIAPRDDALLKRAIDFELGRGGQVFFLHNRVQSIFECASHLRSLAPQARITVAHGQMPEGELEEAIEEFYSKKSNVLVCTSIIESGIDLPSANTILIDRADTFGLAQLYQIRGRVGRGDQRGYAYLLIPEQRVLSDEAKKRLEVIQRFVELGSGFQVASHDLEIRGGGDLLGPQQSGNIQAVGFDLYLELLEEAVQELKNSGSETHIESLREPEIKAPFPAFLPEDFVPDVHQRLSLYRRLSAAPDDATVDDLEAELADRFGKLPVEAIHLLWLIRVKVHLKRLKIDALTVGPERLVLVPGADSSLNPVRAIALVTAYPKRYQLTPDSRFVAARKVSSMKELYFVIQELLEDLSR
jgi:transcription-repair coupling factor (superfamily II helicase)